MKKFQIPSNDDLQYIAALNYIEAEKISQFLTEITVMPEGGSLHSQFAEVTQMMAAAERGKNAVDRIPDDNPAKEKHRAQIARNYSIISTRLTKINQQLKQHYEQFRTNSVQQLKRDPGIKNQGVRDPNVRYT